MQCQKTLNDFSIPWKFINFAVINQFVMNRLLFILCLLFSLNSLAQVPTDSVIVSAEQLMERNNRMCGLKFTDAGLVSKQDP